MAAVSISDLYTIITDQDGTETLVTVADKLGQDLKNKNLTTTQIRALFGEVRQIQAVWSMDGDLRPQALRRLILLKPKMAYRARKERGQAVKELVDVLTPAVDMVVKAENQTKQDAYFKHFVEFFEAILAYHKAYGGS